MTFGLKPLPTFACCWSQAKTSLAGATCVGTPTPGDENGAMDQACPEFCCPACFIPRPNTLVKMNTVLCSMHPRTESGVSCRRITKLSCPAALAVCFGQLASRPQSYHMPNHCASPGPTLCRCVSHCPRGASGRGPGRPSTSTQQRPTWPSSPVGASALGSMMWCRAWSGSWKTMACPRATSWASGRPLACSIGIVIKG